MPDTRTSLILAGDDAPHTALVLVFEGYNLAVTDSSHWRAIRDAWALNTSWTNVIDGLQKGGVVRQSGAPFEAKLQTDPMTFRLLDDDDDTLARIFLRPANNEAATSQLSNSATASMDSQSVYVLMDDSSAFPASGTVYIGTEEIIYTLNGGGGLLTGLSRGVRALFGTSDDPTRFAKPHRINFDPDPSNPPKYSPRVSTAPLYWNGRSVALYLCVEQDGVWTAGEDAECMWAGTIRRIRDVDGDIQIECDHILDKLKATLMRRQYRGYLEDGLWMEAAGNGEFEVKVLRQVQATGVWTSWSASTSTLLPSDDLWSHEEIADLINAQLATWFDGSGVSFDADMTFDLHLSGDGSYQWRFNDTSAGGPFRWEWEIKISPPLGYMLGYTGWVSTDDPFLRPDSGRAFSGVPHIEFIENPPQVRGMPFPGTEGTTLVRVRDVENGTAFEAQPTIPSSIDQTATGFLRIGEKAVIAVRPSGTPNEFIFLGYIPQDAVLGLTPMDTRLNQDGNGDHIPDSLEALFEEGRTDEGVRVEQAWFEIGPADEMFLKMFASTGAVNYNHPTYDKNSEQMGLGLPWGMIDETSMALLSTKDYVLYVPKPEEFLKRFESWLQSRNLHAFWHRGRLTLSSFGESGSATLRITDDTMYRLADGLAPMIGAVPTDQTLDYLVNQVTLRFNMPLGSYGAPRPEAITQNNTASQTDFGSENVAPVEINAMGFYDGVEIVGGDTGLLDDWIANVAGPALAYFGQPLCAVPFTYDISMMHELYPGRQVLLSAASIIHPATGRRGVTDIPAWVVTTAIDTETSLGEGLALYAPGNVT